jgi:hypothetical protein
MSKIPQGEWNAIAARYAHGESITGIAQSYGCTPPAIHYILKRNRQRAASNIEQPLNGRSAMPKPLMRETAQEPAAAENPRSTQPRSDRPRYPHPLPADRSAPRAQAVEPTTGREIRPPQPAGERNQPTGVPRQFDPESIGRGSALTAGLNRELHGHAEAAIEAFRSSFDAALAEGSPSVRQQLRQAASDLMRVAARTTIVLDRLSASAERASVSAQPTGGRTLWANDPLG